MRVYKKEKIKCYIRCRGYKNNYQLTKKSFLCEIKNKEKHIVLTILLHTYAASEARYSSHSSVTCKFISCTHKCCLTTTITVGHMYMYRYAVQKFMV